MEVIYKYISEEEYNSFCMKIKPNETLKIYEDNNMDIEIKKVNRKVYTYINNYTREKTLKEALNNVCSLV